MCDRVVSEDSYLKVSFPDSYKTPPPQKKKKKKRGKAVDHSLAALKFIPDWFVTSKMIIELLTALNADE